MRIAGFDIGVCTWSLRPRSIAQAIARVRQLGLKHYHLGLRPLMFLEDAMKIKERMAIATSGMVITAGMLSFPGEDYTTIESIRATGGVAPDEDWSMRHLMAHQAAAIGAELGISQISFHAGFIPAHMDAQHAKIAARVRAVANIFADYKIDLLLETGQEYADSLAQFLDSLACPNVYVNFDPANMILYGAGDPIEAIEILGRRIKHVHIKDAIASDKPGEEWGKETPFGQGQVDPVEFLAALKRIEYDGYLAVEREGGGDWKTDIPAAIEALRKAESI